MRSIFPVIVIYKVQLCKAPTFLSLLVPSGVNEFLVYDNSPENFQQDLNALPEGALYLRDIENGGLSKAYNTGARLARERGYSHVLLLDQDTTFPDGLLTSYERELSFDGIVAPRMQTDSGLAFSPVRLGAILRGGPLLTAGDWPLNQYGIVNSGCCIPIDRYFEAGGYDENLRLDFADYQFQARFRQICPKVRVLPEIAIQSFSNDSTDPDRIIHRYEYFLADARCCRFSTCRERWRHKILVVRHALALTMRMRSARYVSLLFTRYLFRNKK